MKKKLLSLLLLIILVLPLSAGSTFLINNSAEPGTLDPARASTLVEMRIITSLFDGLFVYDPETCNPIPSLCESWSVSQDGLTYTYYLREALWSDGSAITADDVVYSWLRVLSPETASPQASYIYSYVKGAREYYEGRGDISAVGISSIGTRCVQVELVKPVTYFNDLLASFAYMVVPRQSIERYGSAWTLPGNLVSSGAFTLAEWKPQNQIVLTVNENFWDKSNVALDEVIFYPVTDSFTAYSMYRSGELDWDTVLPYDLISSIAMRRDYQSSMLFSELFMSFNSSRYPFDDANVRKAFYYAIDSDAITEYILHGAAYTAYGLVPDIEGYDIIDESEISAYDPDLAREYLEEAGYPDGRGFPNIELRFSNDPLIRSICEFIQSQLKENLGISVSLAAEEFSVFVSDVFSGQYTAAVLPYTGDYLDPLSFLDCFSVDSSMNFGFYSNERFEKVLDAASYCTDESLRYFLLRRAENILILEDMAIVPLYYQCSDNLIDTRRWGGWYSNPMNLHALRFIYEKEL